VGFLSAARPPLAKAVTMARQRRPGVRVIVATYLLAPGYFADLAVELAVAAGADVVGSPLLDAAGPTPGELVDLVVQRYRQLSAFAPLF
jgi:hypothetical protein